MRAWGTTGYAFSMWNEILFGIAVILAGLLPVALILFAMFGT